MPISHTINKQIGINLLLCKKRNHRPPCATDVIGTVASIRKTGDVVNGNDFTVGVVANKGEADVSNNGEPAHGALVGVATRRVAYGEPCAVHVGFESFRRALGGE